MGPKDMGQEREGTIQTAGRTRADRERRQRDPRPKLHQHGAVEAGEPPGWAERWHDRWAGSSSTTRWLSLKREWGPGHSGLEPSVPQRKSRTLGERKDQGWVSP